MIGEFSIYDCDPYYQKKITLFAFTVGACNAVKSTSERTSLNPYSVGVGSMLGAGVVVIGVVLVGTVGVIIGDAVGGTVGVIVERKVICTVGNPPTNVHPLGKSNVGTSS